MTNTGLDDSTVNEMMYYNMLNAIIAGLSPTAP